MNDAYRERFLRSLGIFQEQELEKLKSTKIAIGGLGLGGSVFINLVRLGFESFHIADPDVFERTNINRQRLAKETSIGRRKDECSRHEALAINPDAQIKTFPEGVKPHNLDEFLDGVDWVIDVVDLFALDDKLALNEAARAKGLPVASCAMVGFAGSVVVFNHQTPSFKELTGISMEQDYKENVSRFVRFIAPYIPDYMREQLLRAMDGSSYIPFVNPGGEIAAAFTAAEVAKSILHRGHCVVAPQGIFVDSSELKIEVFEASYKARGLFEKPRVVKKAG